MPRWRALPDELDPQVREFAEQLRRLVDRSGLGIAALADRTGYSRTSWERYLNGRLLAPKGAVVALAEVTGTSPGHLTTLWELAERAWSRSELRRDMTMEAIRISTERAAQEGTGTPQSAGNRDDGTKPVKAVKTIKTDKPAKPVKAVTAAKAARAARAAGGATAPAAPGVAGPAGVAPTLPPPDPATAPREDATPNSWGLAGYRGPSPAGGRAEGSTAGSTAATAADVTRLAPAVPDAVAPNGPHTEPPRTRTPRPTGMTGGTGVAGDAGAAGGAGGLGGPAGRRRLVMFLAGMVAVLVVVAVALFLTRDDGGNAEAAHTKNKPSATAAQKIPPGVKCVGSGCTGKDAEAMGCAKDTTTVTTVKSATVGTTLVEVRYSSVCRAAWGRITSAAQGEKVTLTAGTKTVSDSITTPGDTIAYTPMVAVKNGSGTKACVTLASGEQGCTP
ncbi:helix-turn-helix domain-containing protein [Streptomyces sp. YIM S03343]